MKIRGGTENMEIIEIAPGDERPQFMSNYIEVLDCRADWTMRLLQSWGASDKIAQTMADMNEERPHRPPGKPVSPQELVMQVCEVVDAAWNEMHHRGWIVKAGSIGEK